MVNELVAGEKNVVVILSTSHKRFPESLNESDPPIEPSTE